MPAKPRFPEKQNVQFSPEQLAWAKQRAEQRSSSVAAVIRDLIQREMADETACRQCPRHCTHGEVQS